jgi:hypothetical protein
VAERLPRLRHLGILCARGGLVVVLALLVAAATLEAARSIEDPDEDVPAAVREALGTAFEDSDDGLVAFDAVADGGWTQLYVFKPLSKPATIERAMHDRSGLELLPTDGPDAAHTLLVFTDALRVLGAAEVDRRRVDLACAVDKADWHPWVGIVRRDRELHVIRTQRRGPPMLAATANGLGDVKRCLRRLPRLR